MTNSVYIATSLDGYIADKNGGLDWLESVPNPESVDIGWADFIAHIDALVMGRTTFETVCGFDMEWPYTKPVFVLSNTMHAIPIAYQGKAECLSGPLERVVETLHQRGFKNLYIDGGKTIQGFLQADLIDDLIITRIPVVLGGGIPLFGSLSEHLMFEHVSTKVALNELVQTHYRRKR